MKILLLAPQPFYLERGTPIAVDLFLQVLSERGDSIDVVTYHIGEDVEYPNVRIFRILKIPFIRAIPVGFSWRKVLCDFFVLLKALKLLIRDRYDYVHAVEESVFIAMVIKWLFKIPFVYDMDSSLAQQMMERYPWIFKPVARFLYYMEGLAVRNAKAVVPVCEALRVDIEKHKPKKVLVLWDVSLVESPLDKDSHDLRDQLHISGRLIMYVGNLEIYQGIDLLLESFSIVIHHFDEASLVIIGGNNADILKYEEKSRQLGLTGKVFFLGPKPVHHLSVYLAQADILVSPRIRGHNTPMKIFSYLGSGKPVVATRLPTHTQVLDDQTACLVEATPEAFSSEILRLMENEPLRNQYGTAGKRLVEERHSFRIFRQKVNSLYEWLEADADRQVAVRIRPAARSPKELGLENLVPQEMRIYYQPIVTLDTGEITGFEALVRWQHPDHGLLSPSEFITRAEETGQIIPIGQWVLHEACRQLREWNLQFPSVIPLTICVNLSAKQLQQPDLIEQIDRVLEETGLDTQSLILEVSDRAILENAESGSEAVLHLQARGVQVHIDYFDAAGDASLRLLEGLPVDKIKIDRALLSGVNQDQAITAKIQHAIDTARNAGVDVVAVGVETKEHLAQVKALKCEFGQGYLFSRPLDEHSVEELMASPPWIEKTVG